MAVKAGTTNRKPGARRPGRKPRYMREEERRAAERQTQRLRRATARLTDAERRVRIEAEKLANMVKR